MRSTLLAVTASRCKQAWMCGAPHNERATKLSLYMENTLHSWQLHPLNYWFLLSTTGPWKPDLK